MSIWEMPSDTKLPQGDSDSGGWGANMPELGGVLDAGIKGLGGLAGVGGASTSLKSSNQQTQNMNFNPVISVGAPAYGASSPFSSSPSFSNSQDDRQGVPSSMGLNGTYSEPGPTVNTDAVKKGSSNYGTYLLLGGAAIAAYILLR